ncbi:MAG: hypothetical protein E6Q76_05560 [Rhizobium sp.]|nr:MAG: hypothetical protein E6Q76_05560 [Rhizobium sp.]
MPATRTVEADTPDAAITFAGIHRSRILSVRQNPLGGLKAAMTTQKLGVSDQITLLAALAAQVSSGQPSNAALARKMAKHPKLQGYQERVAKFITVSDKLQAMGFDPSAVLLCKIGESSGNHAESLENARSYLARKNDITLMIRGPMIMNGIMMFLSSSMITAVPSLGAYIMQQANASGMPLKKNFATYILLAIASALDSGWPYMIAVVVAAILLRKQIWPYLRRWPIISTAHQIILTSRGLRFLGAYTPMFRAGVVSDQAIEYIAKYSSASDRRVYEKMSEFIKSGGSFGASFMEEDWPRDLIDLLETFDTAQMDAKQKLLNESASLMDQQLKSLYAKLGGGIKAFSMAFMMISIICLVYGIYVPITTMKPSMQ